MFVLLVRQLFDSLPLVLNLSHCYSHSQSLMYEKEVKVKQPFNLILDLIQILAGYM